MVTQVIEWLKLQKVVSCPDLFIVKRRKVYFIVDFPSLEVWKSSSTFEIGRLIDFLFVRKH